MQGQSSCKVWYYELQDFFAKFFIVADSQRKEEFHDKLHYSIFNGIRNRVKFITYEQVINRHANLKQLQSLLWYKLCIFLNFDVSASQI